MIDLRQKKVLILAPHPDDEIFGCGGTMHRLKREGAEVLVMFMTVGTTKDFSAAGQSTADQRMKEIAAVKDLMGIDAWSMAFPGDRYHLKLDSLPQHELVNMIERENELALARTRPDILLIPSGDDYNQDHRAVYTAAITATRPATSNLRSFQTLVATYELPYHQWNISASLPNPTLLVPLEETDLEAKLKAITLYGSQIKDPRNPLSPHGIAALARYRGLQCDSVAAEAFHICRCVI
jgi:LmbE family N-acetylglucosaminyl deacetylase